MLNLGVIGYGNRITGVIRSMLKLGEPVRVAAIADPRAEQIRAELGAEGATVRFHHDAATLLAEGGVDGVMIATRCSSHARLAALVAPTGLPLFLEKPVATSVADLRLLARAFATSRCAVVVSFPLRVAPIVAQVKSIIDSGDLGQIEHVQALNNVPYGDAYFMSWMRDEAELGGMFLQKATHDFDYINHLLGDRRPVMVAAMTAKRVCTGDMPAGLKCGECPKPLACMESPHHRFYTRKLTDGLQPTDALCGFAVDTGNEDAGSALIRYDSGMHVSYSQNFVTRRDAAYRGARLIGYRGTVEFDFHSRVVRTVHHHRPITTSSFNA
ncbi:MAG: Gfo/Idh/MocA family oxidoreductase, partial [Planctomycetes bacterium]|nr:Gfo/Idh/MocA family oxidoreductase [Planctomycetota bacterium]